MDQKITQTCITFVGNNGGQGKAFLQLMEDWRMVICFLTIDDMLGRAGLKDMTKGVWSVFVVFCSCGWSVA